MKYQIIIDETYAYVVTDTCDACQASMYLPAAEITRDFLRAIASVPENTFSRCFVPRPSLPPAIVYDGREWRIYSQFLSDTVFVALQIHSAFRKYAQDTLSLADLALLDDLRWISVHSNTLSFLAITPGGKQIDIAVIDCTSRTLRDLRYGGIIPGNHVITVDNTVVYDGHVLSTSIFQLFGAFDIAAANVCRDFLFRAVKFAAVVYAWQQKKIEEGKW